MKQVDVKQVDVKQVGVKQVDVKQGDVKQVSRISLAGMNGGNVAIEAFVSHLALPRGQATVNGRAPLKCYLWMRKLWMDRTEPWQILTT